MNKSNVPSPQDDIAQASIVRRRCLNTLDPDAMIIVAGDLSDKRGAPEAWVNRVLAVKLGF